MAKINYLNEPAERKPSEWALVGKIWPHKSKKDALSGRFGIKTKGGDGQLSDVFNSIEIKAGDPIMIRPNLNMREGKKDPTYLMYMLKAGVEEPKA